MIVCEAWMKQGGLESAASGLLLILATAFLAIQVLFLPLYQSLLLAL